MTVRKSSQLFLVLIFCVGLVLVSGTISPSSKTNKGGKDKEWKLKTGPISENVIQRELVDEEPFSKSIVVESGAYYEDTSLRNFNGTVLGYVTPVS